LRAASRDLQIITMSNSAWDDVKRLADEARVKMHLAGMELKEKWKALEPQIKEAERKAKEGAEKAGDKVTEQVSALAAGLRQFVDELTDSVTRTKSETKTETKTDDKKA
jgi:ElaB/YqjD/DUF883 family membrane-anchored ribosome-binding protein